MAKRSVKSKVKSEVRRQANKHPVVVIIIALIIIIVILLGLFVFPDKIEQFLFGEDLQPEVSLNSVSSSSQSSGESSIQVTTSDSSSYSSVNAEPGEILDNVKYDDFQIHFMQLNNTYAGDSIYIKAGDNDILIDAGSRENSFTGYTKNYIDQYCTDGKLEYVIATHGDQDHIAAFPQVFEAYKVDTVIDFGLTTKTTQIYNSYVTARDASGATHYTSAQCFYNTDGASREIKLSDNVTMEIMYNYYYDHTTSEENNYSVVTMFSYKDLHYLLTGDLEIEGEEKMAEYYDGSTEEKTLPHCELFKAGHHGSPTSSNDCLLSLITPSISVCSCCAGTAEYTETVDNQFPSQAYIDRIAKYTDRVYVPSMLSYNGSSWERSDMNGTVIISSDGVNTGVSATNNVTKLKDTEWFNETIYVIDGKNVSKKGRTDFYTSSTEGAVPRARRTWPEY